MNKELMQQYRARWQAVEDAQREERRATSIDDRWRKLNAIVGVMIGLGLFSELQQDQDSVEVVRQRWERLRQLER